MTITVYDDLFYELEKADKIIAILMVHVKYLSDYDQKRLEQDLKNRGFGDHEATRKKVILQAFNEHPQRDYLMDKNLALALCPNTDLTK